MRTTGYRRLHGEFHGRTSKPTEGLPIRFSMLRSNPSPEDKLTDEQLRKIACEYMERMGYGKQPYIVFKHKDISREHLHIVSLRVDEQGRKLPHDFESPALDGDICVTWSGNTVCIRVSRERSRRTKWDLRKVNYQRGQCQATDLVRRQVVPAKLQMLVLRRVSHAAGTVQRLGRGTHGNHRRKELCR